MECPGCHDTNIFIAKDKKVYIEHIDDYACKVKNSCENYIKTIENLEKELKFKDEYIKQVLKTVNKKLYKKTK